MSNTFFSLVRKTILATMLLATSSSYAQLIIDSGQLVGATNVAVSGYGTYNVSFEDGSCSSVFSGCDSLSDFAFSSFEETIAAGHALLDQVFLDSGLGLFDSNPALINGCEDAGKCIVFIPHKLTDDWVFSQNIVNSASEVNDTISYSSNLGHDQSILGRANTTFAVFTQVSAVPTPTSVWLFALALIGLVTLKRKKTCN